jgi:hypothetical protein
MYTGFLMGTKLGRNRPLEDLAVDGRNERYSPSDGYSDVKLVVVRRQNSRLKLAADLLVLFNDC